MQSSVYLFRIHARKQVTRYEIRCFIAVLLFIFFSIVIPNDFCFPDVIIIFFTHCRLNISRRLTEIKITSRMAYLTASTLSEYEESFRQTTIYTSVLVTSNISKYYDYNRAFSYFASMKPTAAPRDSLSLSKCFTRTGRRKRQSRTLNSQRNQKKSQHP